MRKANRLRVTPSSGNVFRDLGFSTEEAAHLLERTTALVRQSGFREYNNPYTGEGFGAQQFGVSSIVVECTELAREAFAGRRAIA